MTPLSIHMANISTKPRQRWFTFEMVCLAITLAGVAGMFIGTALK